MRVMWFARSFQVAISSALNDNSVTNAVATGLLATVLGKHNCLEISKASLREREREREREIEVDRVKKRRKKEIYSRR